MPNKTAVIYARFSCSKQREASIEDQLRVCHEWCEREGYEVVAEYSDYAQSGRTDQRPQFQRMIANAGESDIVLVYMMDRFSRDPFDAPIYKRELSRHGVHLVSALEAIPDSPEGIIYEKLLEGLAACESRKTAIRVRRGLHGNALKAKTNGVRIFGYGRDADDHFVINETQAAFVREAFSRRLNGESCNTIARDFARRGVTSSRGKPCYFAMIQGMLRNLRYTGRYQYGDVIIEDGMPAIIDKETFERCQTVKARKQRANENWGDFKLSGRVLCGNCGHTMPGVSGRGQSGQKYEYYRCKHCDAVKPVRRDWIEPAIADHIQGILADRSQVLYIAKRIVELNNNTNLETAQRKQAESTLRKATNALRNIELAIEQGIIHPDAQQRIAELEAQQAQVRRTIAMSNRHNINPGDLAEYLQHGIMLDRAALVDAFVYQVLVTAEDVTVTLNFNTKTSDPARFTIQRVRTIEDWWTRPDSNR